MHHYSLKSLAYADGFAVLYQYFSQRHDSIVTTSTINANTYSDIARDTLCVAALDTRRKKTAVASRRNILLFSKHPFAVANVRLCTRHRVEKS